MERILHLPQNGFALFLTLRSGDYGFCLVRGGTAPVRIYSLNRIEICLTRGDVAIRVRGCGDGR
jgi:hypothetical protein